MPFKILKQWIAEENSAGAPNALHAVLSTVGKDTAPHSRVIAIREISSNGLLFFTQAGTRKVVEITGNPLGSLVFWFEIKQRQVVIEGVIEALSQHENEVYWNTYPRFAQIRFLAYAPTSGQVIVSKQILEDKKTKIANEMMEKPIPMSSFYCGFRIVPTRFVYYSYRADELSDVVEYVQEDCVWHAQLISP